MKKYEGYDILQRFEGKETRQIQKSILFYIKVNFFRRPPK